MFIRIYFLSLVPFYFLNVKEIKQLDKKKKLTFVIM